MMTKLKFISLFVPDLQAATEYYKRIFGARECPDPVAPSPHPFASGGPVELDFGSIRIALYQCDMQTTHPGDTGLGMVSDNPEQLLSRAAEHGGNIFYGPAEQADSSSMAIFMLPDHHFFEIMDHRDNL